MSVASDALLQYQNLGIAPPRAASVAPGKVDSKLLSACQNFEAVFIKQMLDAMRQTVPQKGMLDGGVGQNIYNDMLYQQYADKMAKSANFGLARLLYNQLSGQSLDKPLPMGV